MITWRQGLGGFNGGSKYLIKGVFSYSYAIASAIVVTVPDTFGVTGVIKATIGVSSSNISNGQGVSGKIANTIGVTGKI